MSPFIAKEDQGKAILAIISLTRPSMALAVNIMHGCGPINEMDPQLQLRKSCISH